MIRLAFAFLLALVFPAAAQIVQSGPVTPGHVPTWATNGVLQDGGTAAAGNATGFGVTSSNAQSICISSGPITGPYNQLCLGVSPSTGFATIGLTALGGAAPLTLQMCANGTCQSFPFSGGGGGGGTVTSVTGTPGQVNVTPTTPNPTVSLPPLITQAENFTAGITAASVLDQGSLNLSGITTGTADNYLGIDANDNVILVPIPSGGGGIPPGGVSGDVQINNSGTAFAGVTLGNNAVLGNVGSGAASLNQGQLTALVQPYSSSSSGAVPSSAGQPSTAVLYPGGWGALPSNTHDETLSWVSGVNPNGAPFRIHLQVNETVTAIIGRVEAPVGATATASVYEAPSGTPCASGTNLTASGGLNANGAAASDQTLTVTTSMVPAGYTICLVTTGGSAWTSGAGIGGITVYMSP